MPGINDQRDNPCKGHLHTAVAELVVVAGCGGSVAEDGPNS